MLGFFHAIARLLRFDAPSAPRPVAAVTTDNFIRDCGIVEAALNHPDYVFRRKATLARKIGTTSESYLADVLGSIGTRSAYHQSELVGLISRIGARPRRLADMF